MPRPKTTQAPICHPDRRYHAKGLCRQCYDAQWAATKGSDRLKRYRAKVKLLCEVAAMNPRTTSLGALLSDPERLGMLHQAHRGGDPRMIKVWGMLSIPQKAAINYGKVL